MKHPLKRFTIAVTGNFGETRTHDKMKQWIEANGGTFAPKISVEVTHLVCSKEHFKKSVTIGMVVTGSQEIHAHDCALAVQQARKLKDLKIVSFDWLEDSLMKGSPKQEGPYLMNRQVKVAAKVKAEKKAVRKENIQKGCELPSNPHFATRETADRPEVEVFDKSCREFRDAMHSGTNPSLLRTTHLNRS